MGAGFSGVGGGSFPGTITGLEATGGYLSIALNWDDTADATRYEVQRSADGSTGWSTLDDTLESSAYDDTGLADGATWYYRVRAGNASAWGPWSDVVSATTWDYLLYDTFTDTNGTSLAAHTMNVGGGWTAHSGTWTIEGNEAACTLVDESQATADAGQADVEVSCDITTGAGGTFPGIAARWVDANNYWLGLVNDSQDIIQLYERSGGTYTERAAAVLSVAPGTTYTAVLRCSGDLIEFTVGGQTASYSSSSHNTATRCGMRLGYVGGAAATTWDNFKVVVAE